MNLLQHLGVPAGTLTCPLALPAHDAPILETITGIVGGAGTSCATFVPATELGFFSFAPADVSDLQHDGGKVHEVMNASVRRGTPGLISNRPVPAGRVAGTGSLSGGSTSSASTKPSSGASRGR